MKRSRFYAGILTVVFLVTGLGWDGALFDTQSDSLANRPTGPLLTYAVNRDDMAVSVIEQGVLESAANHEVKCQVRGQNTVIWVVENGTEVKVGDPLVRLDTLEIEDTINERTKFAYFSRSAAETSSAAVERAKLAIDAYEQGQFVMDLVTLEKQKAVLESNLRVAENQLQFTLRKEDRGFTTARNLEQVRFALAQLKTDLEIKNKEIDDLKNYTRPIELKKLEGDLKAAESTHAANLERAGLDENRRDLAKAEYELCEIVAEKSGMAIYPSAAEWKETPDVAEGATVHKDQILLLIPDLTKMQVKVGIHESIIERVKPGMKAIVEIAEQTYLGKIKTVASVAKPAGWWTGNVVKYDTIVELPNVVTLNPGMSAEVTVILAEYEDVLNIPVSAVLETPESAYCWVVANGTPTRRTVTLGDNNDVFIHVTEGLAIDEVVVLNPQSSIKEAQDLALTLRAAQEALLDETESLPEKPEKPAKSSK